MRHLCAPFEVPLLPRGVVQASAFGLLIPPPRPPHAASSGLASTHRTVAIAAITSAAQDDLRAAGLAGEDAGFDGGGVDVTG